MLLLWRILPIILLMVFVFRDSYSEVKDYLINKDVLEDAKQVLLEKFTLVSADNSIAEESEEDTDTLSPREQLLEIAQSSGIPNISLVIQQLNTIEDMEKALAIAISYYPHMLTQIIWKDEDVVFSINNQHIWYAEGRLLGENNNKIASKFRRVIYPYRIEPLIDIFDDLPVPRERFSEQYVRASDFQQAVVGGTPTEIEPLISNYRILEIPVRLHSVAGIPAVQASQTIIELAKTDSEIRKFIDDLKTISGYKNRTVKNSSNISMHAYGLAFDLIPYSYNGKLVYWQWTKDWYPKKWTNLPLSQRWMIPQKIVEIFESHGFIWGGKWPHYDMMHFEYRPELITYANIRATTGSSISWGSNSNDIEVPKGSPNESK